MNVIRSPKHHQLWLHSASLFLDNFFISGKTKDMSLWKRLCSCPDIPVCFRLHALWRCDAALLHSEAEKLKLHRLHHHRSEFFQESKQAGVSLPLWKCHITTGCDMNWFYTTATFHTQFQNMSNFLATFIAKTFQLVWHFTHVFNIYFHTNRNSVLNFLCFNFFFRLTSEHLSTHVSGIHIQTVSLPKQTMSTVTCSLYKNTNTLNSHQPNSEFSFYENEHTSQSARFTVQEYMKRCSRWWMCMYCWVLENY